MLDIRNNYEWDVGRFKQAERLRFTKFKEFQRLVEDRVRGREERPVMMYCTGGIRCEVFSSLLVKAGVKNVFQLEESWATAPGLWRRRGIGRETCLSLMTGLHYIQVGRPNRLKNWG